MGLEATLWQGITGESVEFRVFHPRQPFEAFGAVFLYAKYSPDGAFDMVYINQTDRMDLVARNPIADYVLATFEPNSLHVWKCEDIDERRKLMNDLILRHNPPGNRGRV